MDFFPELLKTGSGNTVNAQNWKQRRNEILDIFANYAYGRFPSAPEKVTGKKLCDYDRIAAGLGYGEKIELSFQTETGEFSFPFNLFVPDNGKKNPVFVMINFRPDVYDMYYPLEEIINSGFALAVVCYNDITSDDGNMHDGILGHYSRRYDGTDWGKISAWAFGTSRVIDYLLTRDDIDPENIAVAGHSRLGKTALWCAANDERVKLACSNDSGCAGAAYERIKHKGAENSRFIINYFPYWFCGNCWKYAGEIEKAPFDQHLLIASICPRYVCVGSAEKDNWADQYSEQLSCIGASPAWELFGKSGFIGPETPAKVDDDYFEGSIGYHLRRGVHFFSRNDWISYMRFFKRILER